jgi:hypothetical protein
MRAGLLPLLFLLVGCVPGGVTPFYTLDVAATVGGGENVQFQISHRPGDGEPSETSGDIECITGGTGADDPHRIDFGNFNTAGSPPGADVTVEFVPGSGELFSFSVGVLGTSGGHTWEWDDDVNIPLADLVCASMTGEELAADGSLECDLVDPNFPTLTGTISAEWGCTWE